jgi:hypothetical protein
MTFTVGELKELIKDLPDDMEVVAYDTDGNPQTECANTGILENVTDEECHPWGVPGKAYLMIGA